MSELLNIKTPNVEIKGEHCYSEYTHEKPLVNKTSDGKYVLQSEFTKYTIRTNLKVPKGSLIIFFCLKVD